MESNFITKDAVLSLITSCILARGCKTCKAPLKRYGSRMVRCSEKYCGRRYSIYKGTVFQDCKIPILLFIEVIDRFLRFESRPSIAYNTGLSMQAVSRIIQKFNDNPILESYIETLCIGGNGQVVEIDESKFGKRKYNRGHRVEGVWVFGMVDRLTRRIVVQQVEKRNKKTLVPILKKRVRRHSTIYSDGWKAYTNLNKWFFKHKAVNHSKEFLNRSNGAHINTIEGNWAGIKRNIPVRVRTKSLIDIYLLRFMLDRNHSNTKLKDIFFHSLNFEYN